eukprot:157044_1
MNHKIATSWVRWLFCGIICLNTISLGFNRYNLVPIQDQIISWYNINAIDYNILMTLYIWPNVICGILFGIFTDKIGVRKIIILSWFITIIGLFTVFYSSIIKNYILLCIARLIVGIGNEGLSLSLKLYLIEFFKPNEYSIAFSFVLSSPSIGNMFNTYFSYQIYVLFGIITAVSIPLIIAPFVCILLFTTMIVEKYIYSSTETQKL